MYFIRDLHCLPVIDFSNTKKLRDEKSIYRNAGYLITLIMHTQDTNVLLIKP